MEPYTLLRGNPLKIVDHVTYLGCNISSIESDVNILIARAGTTITRYENLIPPIK